MLGRRLTLQEPLLAVTSCTAPALLLCLRPRLHLDVQCGPPLPEGRAPARGGGGRRQGEAEAVRRDGAVLKVEDKNKVEDQVEDKVEEDVVRLWDPQCGPWLALQAGQPARALALHGGRGLHRAAGAGERLRELWERVGGGAGAAKEERARTMDLRRSVQVQLQEVRGQRPAGGGVTDDRVDRPQSDFPLG